MQTEGSKSRLFHDETIEDLLSAFAFSRHCPDQDKHLMQQKKNGWRLRVALRTLLILGIFVATYFVLAHLTRQHGKLAVEKWIVANGEVARRGLYVERPLVCVEWPLVCSRVENTLESKGKAGMLSRITKKYYLWAFGPVYEMPFESEYVDSVGPDGTIQEILNRRIKLH